MQDTYEQRAAACQRLGHALVEWRRTYLGVLFERLLCVRCGQTQAEEA